MDSRTEFQIVMGALELGIIPPNRSIDEALAKMNPTERRKCKRKYRKIVRCWARESEPLGKKWMEYSPGQRRMAALHYCNQVGVRIIEQPIETE